MTDPSELGDTFDAIRKLVQGNPSEPGPQIDYRDMSIQLPGEAPDERQRGWARYFLEQVHYKMEEDLKDPRKPPTVTAQYIAQRFQSEAPDKSWQFSHVAGTVPRMIGMLGQDKQRYIERADARFPLYEKTIRARERQIQEYEDMRLLLRQAENLLQPPASQQTGKIEPPQP